MGTSTDGILFFGICFDDEDDRPDLINVFMEKHNAEEFDEAAEIELGIPQFPNPSRDYKKAKETLIAGCPVEEVMHCSLDCTMYGYAVRGTETTASRGYPENVAVTERPDRTDEFIKWFADRGMEVEPKWWLVSLWA